MYRANGASRNCRTKLNSDTVWPALAGLKRLGSFLTYWDLRNRCAKFEVQRGIGGVLVQRADDVGFGALGDPGGVALPGGGVEGRRILAGGVPLRDVKEFAEPRSQLTESAAL